MNNIQFRNHQPIIDEMGDFGYLADERSLVKETVLVYQINLGMVNNSFAKNDDTEQKKWNNWLGLNQQVEYDKETKDQLTKEYDTCGMQYEEKRVICMVKPNEEAGTTTEANPGSHVDSLTKGYMSIFKNVMIWPFPKGSQQRNRLKKIQKREEVTTNRKGEMEKIKIEEIEVPMMKTRPPRKREGKGKLVVG